MSKNIKIVIFLLFLGIIICSVLLDGEFKINSVDEENTPKKTYRIITIIFLVLFVFSFLGVLGYWLVKIEHDEHNILKQYPNIEYDPETSEGYANLQKFATDFVDAISAREYRGENDFGLSYGDYRYF